MTAWVRPSVRLTSTTPVVLLLALLLTRSDLSAQSAAELSAQCAAVGGDATICAVGA